MTIDELIATIEDKQPPAPLDRVSAFEGALGHSLPEDYRAFLVACNGGSLGGALQFAFSSVHHVGGFRDESYFSLEHAREVYDDRIPRGLIWIMDDPGGNAICLGVGGEHHGQVYFWSHEFEPDEDEWDGAIESAGNVKRIAASFTGFVDGLQRHEAPAPRRPLKSQSEAPRPWWKLW